MIKKIFNLIFITILSLKVIFAAENNFINKLSEPLSIFGSLYSSLLSSNGEPNLIANGIALIFVAVGIFWLMNYLMGKFMKGDGSAQARKGIAIISTIFLLGGLLTALKDGETFLGFYGSMTLFFFVMLLMVSILIRTLKESNETQSLPKKIFIISIGLIIIDLTLSSLANRLFNQSSQPNIIGWILNNLGDLVGIAILLIVFYGIFFLFKKGVNNVSDRNKKISEEPEIKQANLIIDKIRKNNKKMKDILTNLKKTTTGK